MFKLTSVSIVALSASLCACGGGGSTGPSASDKAMLGQALTNIVQTLPAASPAFVGAFVHVNGVSAGWAEGNSVDDVARKLANDVYQNSLSHYDAYKAMLSDAGLSIVVHGEATGKTSAITGVPLYYPDVKFVARVGKDGIVGVVRV